MARVIGHSSVYCLQSTYTSACRLKRRTRRQDGCCAEEAFPAIFVVRSPQSSTRRAIQTARLCVCFSSGACSTQRLKLSKFHSSKYVRMCCLTDGRRNCRLRVCCCCLCLFLFAKMLDRGAAATESSAAASGSGGTTTSNTTSTSTTRKSFASKNLNALTKAPSVQRYVPFST